MALKIIIADYSWKSTDVEKKYLPSDGEVREFQCKTEEDVINACADADAILAEYAPLSARVLKSLKKCKIISQTAIGYDNIDVKTAQERGIAVANVPGYCVKEVADHTMALILANQRNIVNYDRAIRDRVWDQNNAPPMQRLETLTLGLVGFGGTAQEVAVRAQGFGMKVVAYDPYAHKEPAANRKVKLVELKELLNLCEVISCHLPLTPETLGFFNLNRFRQMKKHPLFVNSSRGKVIIEEDLITALEEGMISGAALDVLESEPPDFTSKLFHMKNVIITPHAGFLSETALEEVCRRSALNVYYFFENRLDKVNLVK